MSPELREALKQAVDAKVREREGVWDKSFKCRTCGCDYDDFTTGCRSCIARRASRLKRGFAMVRRCSGCSGHLNELNPGCNTCRERSKARGYGRNGDYRPERRPLKPHHAAPSF